MTEREALDNLIRQSVREAVAGQEPSAGVRDALLAAAAQSDTLRSAVGPEVPPLADGLCEIANETELEHQSSEPLRVAYRPWLLLTAPLYAVR